MVKQGLGNRSIGPSARTGGENLKDVCSTLHVNIVGRVSVDGGAVLVRSWLILAQQFEDLLVRVRTSRS
jgi:hypothetical protein